MEILPSGDVRVVYAGPVRLVANALGKWPAYDTKVIQQRARALDEAGLVRIRPAEEDSSARSIFDLAGTKVAIFPVEPVVVLDLPTEEMEAGIQNIARALLPVGGPFTSVKVAGNILRIFANGYAAIALTLDFICRDDADRETYIAFLGERLAFDSPESAELREAARLLINDIVARLCRELIGKPWPWRSTHECEAPFLSTFYVMSASWTVPRGKVVRLSEDLRSLIQPEPGEPMLNHSTSGNELVIYTAGFHLYVHNTNSRVDPVARSVALVCFLNLMNILYAQMDDIKDVVKNKLDKRITPFFVPTDIDERLEALYSQMMVSSATWRRDISSFTEQIRRRWRFEALKQYCFSLIAALEARSERRRTRWLTAIVILFTVSQAVSFVEDGWQILDRVGVTRPPPAGQQAP